MTTGGAARTQPLGFVISTAGDEKSLIYQEEIRYARNVLEGTITDHSVFALIFELDEDDDPYADDFDIETFTKSNPNFGCDRLVS